MAEKFNKNGRSIGAPIRDITKIQSLTSQIIPTRKATEIFNGIHVTGEIPRIHEIEETGGPFYNDHELNHPDPLLDDQALYIETGQGLIIVLGCGHSGVINTLQYIKTLSSSPIHAVLGGMHLLNASTERLTFTSDALQSQDITYIAPNHCTGINAICHFKNHLAETINASNVGSKHHFGI